MIGIRKTGHAPRYRLCFLFDSPHFYPPFTSGGSVGQCYALACSLREQDIDLFVVARRGASDLAGSNRQVRDIQFSYLAPAGDYRGRGWAALTPNLLYVLRVFFFLLQARSSYDIVVVSGFRLLAVPAGLAARIARKKCVVRIEDSNDLTFALTRQSTATMGTFGRHVIHRCLRLIYWAAFRLVDNVIAFTPEIGHRLTQMGACGESIAQIPNGIDAATFSPVSHTAKLALRTRLDLPLDKIVLIYSGRLSRDKGIPKLLEVWRHLIAARNDIYLVILGSGDSSFDGCELEARNFIKEHGFGSTVIMPGNVPNVSEYLQASDLFVFLSVRENFSLSILEALNVGLPSILTRVGGAPMTEQEAGWGDLVDVDAPVEVVVSKIKWLLSVRAQWPQMSATAHRIVSAKYTIEAVRNQYIALFNQLFTP